MQMYLVRNECVTLLAKEVRKAKKASDGLSKTALYLGGKSALKRRKIRRSNFNSVLLSV